MNCKTPAFSIDTVIPVNHVKIGDESPTELNWKTGGSSFYYLDQAHTRPQVLSVDPSSGKFRQNSTNFANPLNLPGILPMQVAPDTLDSLLSIKVTHKTDRGNKDVTTQFTFTPVLKSVPAALWGKAGDIPANNPNPKTSMVQNTLMGFELHPVAPGNLIASIDSCAIQSDKLGKIEPPVGSILWEKTGPAPTSTLTADQRRDGILQDLGMGESQIDFSHMPASETLLRYPSSSRLHS